MDLENCPNCAGILAYSTDKSKKICSYCDAEFPIVERQMIQNKEVTKVSCELTLSQKLFDIRIDVDSLHEDCKSTFITLCQCINANNPFQNYEAEFSKIAQKNFDIAVPGINSDLLEKVKSRLANQLKDDERIILYKDSGIISKAKVGILITDKRLYCIDKKKINILQIKDIETIKSPFIGNAWDFNKNLSYSLNSISCNQINMGIILAYICTLARDANPVGYKITIEKYL